MTKLSREKKTVEEFHVGILLLKTIALVAQFIFTFAQRIDRVVYEVIILVQ